MKISITPNSKLILNASFALGPQSASLIINTKERWHEPYRIARNTHPKEASLEFFFDSFDESIRESVEFIPETEDEKIALHRVRFLCHEKDQLFYLLPDISFIPKTNKTAPPDINLMATI